VGIRPPGALIWAGLVRLRAKFRADMAKDEADAPVVYNVDLLETR